MLKKLYDWTIAFAHKPSAPYALGAVSFTESSFFPVPPDALLLPMCLSRPERAYFYAFICTITSVLGGILGYAIGALLYDTVGQWLINAYGLASKMDAFRASYQNYGHWVILLKGLTPIPFKLVTITSGLAGYDFFWFVVLSLITRGARFYGVALIMFSFGDKIRAFVEKHLVFLAIIFVVGLVGGFYAFKVLL